MARKRAHFIVEGLFGFEGRMRRSEFWLMSIGVGVIKFVLALVLTSVMGLMMDELRGVYVRLAIDLLFFWPILAFMVRRGHDRSRSTFYSIAFTVIFTVLGAILTVLTAPLAAAGANADMDLQVAFVVVWILYVSALIYWFVDYGCLDGTKGRNRFGGSPKGAKGPGDQDLAQVFS